MSVKGLMPGYRVGCDQAIGDEETAGTWNHLRAVLSCCGLKPQAPNRYALELYGGCVGGDFSAFCGGNLCVHNLLRRTYSSYGPLDPSYMATNERRTYCRCVKELGDARWVSAHTTTCFAYICRQTQVWRVCA